MFDSIFEALDSLIVVFLIHIDIRKVVVGVGVARVDFNTFFVVLLRLLYLPHFLVDVCHVVIKHIEFRVDNDCFVEVLDCFIVLFHFEVGVGYRVIESIHLVFELLCLSFRFGVVLQRLLILTQVIKGLS